MVAKAGVKTSEFWLNLFAVLIGAFVNSGLLADTHWAVRIAGIALAGLGVFGYTGARKAIKLGATLLCCSLALGSCVTTATGEREFSPQKAVDTACAITPALGVITQKGICENLNEPARTKCLKIAAIVQASAGVGLAIGGSIAEACKVPER